MRCKAVGGVFLDSGNMLDRMSGEIWDESMMDVARHGLPGFFISRGFYMSNEGPLRRMTLRQLLTHSEKCSRDMLELCNTALLTRLSEFRDLSRPTRHRSNYPTMLAIGNALKKVTTAHEEIHAMTDYLNDHLQAIREHAVRERVARL